MFESQPNEFLPIPEQRESIFIDFAEIQPLADLHIKGRALNPHNKKPNLSAFLKDGGLNKLSALKGLDIRFDYAIIDAVREIKLHAVDGIISETGYDHLKHLMLLCSLNSEYSEYFPITPQVREGRYTIKDAVKIFNTLIERYAKYSKLLVSAKRGFTYGRRL